MGEVRADLLRNQRFGPWAAFKTAVENEMRAGRVREDVDPVQVASVCVAIFDGIVHARIARLLQCDMEDTLRKSYAAVWRSMAVAPGASPAGQSPGGASD